MIYANPGAPFEAVLDNAPTGLVGTVGVQILDTPAGTVVTARSTTGIEERPAGTGLYAVTLTAPTIKGGYSVIWDTGGSSPQYAREELQVVADVPTISASSGYTTPDAVRMVLAPDGNTDPSTAASMSDEELQEAIDEGASEINARLGSRYSVPFAGAVPVLIEKLDRDIAAFMATLVFQRGAVLDPDSAVVRRYNRAKDLLDQLADGGLGLLGDSGEIAQTAEAAVVNRYEGDLFVLEDFDLAPSGAPGFEYYRYRSSGGW